MLKTKTFIFNTTEINPYREYKENDVCYSGGSRIDSVVNSFCSVHNVVDIKTTTHQQGNNPPTFFIDYTIIYKED